MAFTDTKAKSAHKQTYRVIALITAELRLAGTSAA